MMKYFLLFFILLPLFAYAEGQLFTDWLKTGPAKQPRYFLKNSRVSLCGLLDEVTAFKVDKPEEKIQIKSCLMASDSLDDGLATAFEVVDLKGENLLIRDYIAKHEPKPLTNPIYAVSAKSVATLWAMRFPEGEVMFYGPKLCDKMYDWRTERSLELSTELPSNPIMPFPTKSKGEAVRYHVFEYHMGCGT